MRWETRRPTRSVDATCRTEVGPMKAKTTALMLTDLGRLKSHSRPHTSNDKPVLGKRHFKDPEIPAGIFPKNFESIQHCRRLLPQILLVGITKSTITPHCLMTPDQIPLRDRPRPSMRPERPPSDTHSFKTPRALRPTNRRNHRKSRPAVLDQNHQSQTEGNSSLKSKMPNCLKVVDTFLTVLALQTSNSHSQFFIVETPLASHEKTGTN